MLTNAINLDGLFSYLLYAERYIPDGEDEVKYRIKTRTDGNDTCRSVAGCFKDKYIDPNMKFIVDTITDFENGETELVYDGKRGISFLSVEGAKEIGIEFNSLSKTYNLTGARISFAVFN